MYWLQTPLHLYSFSFCNLLHVCPLLLLHLHKHMNVVFSSATSILSPIFPHSDSHCIIKQMGGCGVKSMTADLTVLENQDHYTLQETVHHLRVTLCEGIVFSVATGLKSSQICFGRDPVVLVSLIAFPTTLHDYQIMCSRTQTNTLQFVPLLITICRLNLHLFLANILPLLPFPFSASSMLSQLDGNLHLLIVCYLTNVFLGLASYQVVCISRGG